MSSPSHINKANAQHSTGPKTESGKQASSLNALRHGLTSQVVVMPHEDLAAYQSHTKSFTDEYNPVGATEVTLVQSLADTSWRLMRVAALETNLLSLVTSAEQIHDASKTLSNLSLHTQRLTRQFERTVAELRDLQKSRLDHEDAQLHELLEIEHMYDNKGETYNREEDGFVFTQAQINRGIQARNRAFLLDKAAEDE